MSPQVLQRTVEVLEWTDPEGDNRKELLTDVVPQRFFTSQVLHPVHHRRSKPPSHALLPRASRASPLSALGASFEGGGGGGGVGVHISISGQAPTKLRCLHNDHVTSEVCVRAVQEIDLLARANGLKVVGCYGEMAVPFVDTDHEDSYALVMVLQKPQ